MSQQLTLAQVKAKVKTRYHLYSIISQTYRLPDFNSRAITTDYLKACVLSPCPIFRIKRSDYNPPFIPTRHCTADDIFIAIEKLLKAQKKPPTGLSMEKFPDLEWLIAVYFYLSPSDEMKLFPKSINPDTTIQVSIDKDIADLLFAENYKRTSRSIFNITEDKKKPN